MPFLNGTNANVGFFYKKKLNAYVGFGSEHRLARTAGLLSSEEDATIYVSGPNGLPNE